MSLIITLNVKYPGFSKEKPAISDTLFDVRFMVSAVFSVDSNAYYIPLVFVSV